MSCHCRACVERTVKEEDAAAKADAAWKMPTELDIAIARQEALTRLYGSWLSYAAPPEGLQRAQWGVLFRWSSLWIGAHWSPYNRRWCINLLPCVTLWVALKGGKTP